MQQTDINTDDTKPSTAPNIESPNVSARKNRAMRRIVLSIAIPASVACVTVLGLIFFVPKPIDKATVDKNSSTTEVVSDTQSINTSDQTIQPEITGLQLDTNKNYGNKYSNGLLPVGDNKYSTTAASKGTVFLCHAPNGGEGGAGTRGPWFTNNNTQYDINKKAKVSGSVSWEGNYSMSTSGSNRIITTNDLPINHTTGVFPISSKDAAYLYDRNPNSIKSQTLSYTLPLVPTMLSSPACMGGESGVMTTGVALFNGFDAGGRDAGAWEVQDSCSGHPQNDGEYHYHTLSSCITDINVTKVIGFALDGYPITGPTVGTNNILTTDDLDECHGIISNIILDGKNVLSYHYVMTQDFPYSVSCFKATASTQVPGPGH